MKILWVCSEVAGVAFYRIVQPARYLEKRGHQVRVLGYDKNAWKRPEWEGLSDIRYADAVTRDIENAVRWADVTVWMALHTTDSFRFFHGLRARFPQKAFVMELDDIVFNIPSYNIANTVYYPGSQLTAISSGQMKLSDALIVSTPGLKEQLSDYNENIHVVENAIDLSLWRLPSSSRQGVTIGWVGGGTHTQDLESVKDVVFEILAKYPNVEFKFLHGCPEFFKHKPDCSWVSSNDPRYDKSYACTRCGGIERIRWTHDFKPVEKYPKWVSSHGFDIGIAPLVDNSFNRAKSNLRYLEYSAMGIPTVASNVAHFNETIRHGENGFLAETKQDWVNCLSQLAESVSLRKTVGENAKNTVKREWNPKVIGEKYLRTLKEIYAVTNQKFADNASRATNQRPEQHAVHS